MVFARSLTVLLVPPIICLRPTPTVFPRGCRPYTRIEEEVEA